jgi:Ca2+-binding EF-hand superfamily protein
VTAQDIRMRAIDTVFKRTDADASGTLSRDEIASAIASLGIEMNVSHNNIQTSLLFLEFSNQVLQCWVYRSTR